MKEGRFHVFINKYSKKLAKVRLAVEDILKERNITKYRIQEMKENEINFMDVGAEVGEPETARGSLGCFALNEFKSKEKSRLCAIIAKHVAVRQNDARIFLGQDENEQRIFANILTPHVDMDIAAAAINKQDTQHFDTRLKDERGRPVRACALFDFSNIRNTPPRLVYIWGFQSQPGCGEIVYENCRLKRCPGSRYVFIRNRQHRNSKSFSRPGDSGSIVCGINRNGTVTAIAILSGKCLQKINKEISDEEQSSAETLKKSGETTENVETDESNKSEQPSSSNTCRHNAYRQEKTEEDTVEENHPEENKTLSCILYALPAGANLENENKSEDLYAAAELSTCFKELSDKFGGHFLLCNSAETP